MIVSHDVLTIALCNRVSGLGHLITLYIGAGEASKLVRIAEVRPVQFFNQSTPRSHTFRA